MKNVTLFHHMVRTAIVVLTLFGSAVQARVVSPAGTFSDARDAAPVIQVIVLNRALPFGVQAILPVAPTATSSTGLPSSAESASLGVAVVQRLQLPPQQRLSRSRYALDARLQAELEDRVVVVRESPDTVDTSAWQRVRQLATDTQPFTSHEVKFDRFVSWSRGQIAAAVEQVSPKWQHETPLALKPYRVLTPEEFRFLSGLLLYQRGHNCAVAIELFHSLSQKPSWQAEADHYMALCSRELSITTDFVERERRVIESQDFDYSLEAMRSLPEELPSEFVEPVGFALDKISQNTKVMSRIASQPDAATLQTKLAYWLTTYGAATEKFSIVMNWSVKVPEGHHLKPQALFYQSLAEYQASSKQHALEISEKLLRDQEATHAKNVEFTAVVALNLARMYFQESKFKLAHAHFMKVYKDHPLWVQSLIEFGWSQLQSGDYEGAIGNMYSMQSPFFNALYKPESFVIRSIGYLKLCQYGDAYRSLTLLENEYRPVFDSLNKYMGDQPKAYQTVRKFLAGPASAKEVDGLSTHLIRELARHRDFINAQKSINRQIDERASYAKFAGQVDRELKRVQERVTSLRIRINELRKQIVVELKHPDSRAQVADISSQADQAMNDLNQAFFDIDILKVARDSWPEYNRDVVAGADRRLSAMTKDLDRILTNRLVRMQNDLSRILDNNELLRYEVFAGSGENLRYQVSGGERGQRVPANVIPKSKSLQWHFDGEFWEDEIGHYRSSLKNNCPSVEPKLEAGGQVAAGQSTQGAE